MGRAEILNNSVFRFVLDRLFQLHYTLLFSHLFRKHIQPKFSSASISEIKNSKHKYAINRYITDSEMDDIAVTIICRETQLTVTEQNKTIQITVPCFGNTFIKVQVRMREQISHSYLRWECQGRVDTRHFQRQCRALSPLRGETLKEKEALYGCLIRNRRKT